MSIFLMSSCENFTDLLRTGGVVGDQSERAGHPGGPPARPQEAALNKAGAGNHAQVLSSGHWGMVHAV